MIRNGSQGLEAIADLMAPFGPALPPARMVEEINRLYHAVGAEVYDRTHPEIHEQLPPIWKSMCGSARELLSSRKLRVLDFGCGTGFEAGQIIENFGADSISEVVCVDASPEMLARCRDRLRRYSVQTRYFGSLEDIEGAGYFDVFATNSVLHHLPDPVQVVARVRTLLKGNVVWLAGHEPSARFYRNAQCESTFRRYWRWHRAQRLLDPRAYWRRLKEALGFGPGLELAAAQKAVERGLFRRRPRRVVVDRIVDLHVAHSVEEAAKGRGFDFRDLKEVLRPHWHLEWVKTYSFMGPVPETELSTRWCRVAADLARRYPDDGANFSAVWSLRGRERAT